MKCIANRWLVEVILSGVRHVTREGAKCIGGCPIHATLKIASIIFILLFCHNSHWKNMHTGFGLERYNHQSKRGINPKNICYPSQRFALKSIVKIAYRVFVLLDAMQSSEAAWGS